MFHHFILLFSRVQQQRFPPAMATKGDFTPLLKARGVEPGPNFIERMREKVDTLGLGFRDLTLSLILEIR